MKIIPGDFSDPRIIELLNAHFVQMRSTAPVESCHVLPIDEMQVPELKFWAAWEGEELLGVGGLKQLSPGHGEIKSMHTRDTLRGKGVGAAMLLHIIKEAKADGMTRLSLETGVMDFFKPAHALYARHGFVDCPPFGDYVADPNSVFMNLALTSE